MKSYKQWQKLDESIGARTLGLGHPTNLGTVGSRWDEGLPPMKSDMDMPMPMKKKKGKPMPPMDDEEAPDMGDEEAPDMDDEEAPDMGDEGDEDLGDEEDPDMGDEGDEDLGDEEDPDMGDEEDPDMGEEDPDMGGEEEPVMPPMKSKKKSDFLGKTKAVRDGASMMHKGASKMIKGMKESTKMTKEEYEFWKSLESMGGTHFAKDKETGEWVQVSEDAIIPPTDPNENITEEPGPGDVGYAPQGRVGELGTFAEWSSKYTDEKPSKKSKKKQKKPIKQSWFS